MQYKQNGTLNLLGGMNPAWISVQKRYTDWRDYVGILNRPLRPPPPPLSDNERTRRSRFKTPPELQQTMDMMARDLAGRQYRCYHYKRASGVEDNW